MPRWSLIPLTSRPIQRLFPQRSNRTHMIPARASDNSVLNLPGGAGNNATTPDSAALSLTGDFDIRVDMKTDDWTPAAREALVAKWVGAGNLRSYAFVLDTDGSFELLVSETGSDTDTMQGLTATGFAANVRRWVRVTFDSDNGAAGRDATFYTSSDGITWSQLGSVVTIATASGCPDFTQALEIGSINSGGSLTASVKIYRIVIYSDLTETTKVFDANFAAEDAGTTSFTESSSEAATVTINGTAAIITDT